MEKIKFTCNPTTSYQNTVLIFWCVFRPTLPFGRFPLLECVAGSCCSWWLGQLCSVLDFFSSWVHCLLELLVHLSMVTSLFVLLKCLCFRRMDCQDLGFSVVVLMLPNQLIVICEWWPSFLCGILQFHYNGHRCHVFSALYLFLLFSPALLS